jgi:cysteine desulfurase
MGLPPDIAQGAIRVSLGIGTMSADIERFIGAWSELIKRMRQRQEAA